MAQHDATDKIEGNGQRSFCGFRRGFIDPPNDIARDRLLGFTWRWT